MKTGKPQAMDRAPWENNPFSRMLGDVAEAAKFERKLKRKRPKTLPALDGRWFFACQGDAARADEKDRAITVRIFPDKDHAEEPYYLARTIGGPRRIGMGKCRVGWTEETIKKLLIDGGW